MYVALARRRELAVLDAVSDEVRARIPLAPLGERVVPWYLGVGPAGEAAVVSLTTPPRPGPQIGVVSDGGGAAIPPVRSGRRAGARRAAAGAARCAWVPLEPGSRGRGGAGMSTAAQGLAADQSGHAYVLVADAGAQGPSYAAMVSLARGALVRRLPLAGPGEVVLSLHAQPDGEMVYASIWQWGTYDGPGSGRLVAVDTRTAQVQAEVALPRGTAATDLSLAGAPGTAGSASSAMLYAVLTDPGPSLDDDTYWPYGAHHWLGAFRPAALKPAGEWALDGRPAAVAVSPDGVSAYLLSSGGGYGAWGKQLTCLDLATATTVRQWPLSGGCFSLALCATGKLYVADVLADRLWRIDTRTNTLLGGLPMPGAPIAVAARPG